METKETTWVVNKITVEIWRHGCDDYAAYFYEMDYSVRGTLKQVVNEISFVCGEEN